MDKENNGLPALDTEPVSVKAGPNWALRGFAVLLCLVVGAGGALYFLPVLQDRVPALAGWTERDGAATTELETQISGLKKQLRAHEEAIEFLELRPQFPPGFNNRLVSIEERLKEKKAVEDISQSARIDMLLGRMSQLEASFVPLSKGLVDAADAKLEREELSHQAQNRLEILTGIEARLKPLEEFTARDTSTALLGLYISNLGEKVRQGVPFTAELADIRNMIASGALADDAIFQEQLDRLSRFAAKGIPTYHRLEQSFKDMIPGLLARQDVPDDAGWWTKTLEGFKKLVRLRKVENFDGRDFDALIAKAENALSAFDLRQVLDVMKSLPSAVQALLKDWMEAARTHLEAEDAVKELHNRLSGVQEV